MPYIDHELRAEMENHLQDMMMWIENEGDLNYVITRLCLDYVGSSPNYAGCNSAIGVLECAKLELYRRLVAPYEDRKIAENGDVFDDYH